MGLRRNKEGHCFKFFYLEADGIERCTQTDGTNFTIKIGDIYETGARDCWFWVSSNEDKDNPNHGPYKFLTYLGTDNRIWKTEIDCSGGGTIFDRGISICVESSRDGGQFKNNNFEIQDWDGSHWKVEIDKEVEARHDGNPVPVGFTLTFLRDKQ